MARTPALQASTARPKKSLPKILPDPSTGDLTDVLMAGLADGSLSRILRPGAARHSFLS